ncbi:hypothetical protein ACU686_06450 [Yinghuangia aomiensis]
MVPSESPPRFRDDLSTIYDFMDEILIRCPRCGALATVAAYPKRLVLSPFQSRRLKLPGLRAHPGQGQRGVFDAEPGCARDVRPVLRTAAVAPGTDRARAAVGLQPRPPGAHPPLRRGGAVTRTRGPRRACA